MEKNIVLLSIKQLKAVKYIRILLFILVLNFCLTCGAIAQNLELTNLVLDSQNGSIQVRFGLDVKDPDLLKDFLQDDGALLQLRCQIKLYRQRSFWWNELLAKKTVDYKLKGNPEKKKYWLKDSRKEKFVQKKDLAALLKSSWQHMHVGLGPWIQLTKGEAYSLYLKVSMKRIDVPKWLQRALFFWSWDVLPENTYRLDFSY